LEEEWGAVVDGCGDNNYDNQIKASSPKFEKKQKFPLVYQF
jgi:hypothetical protein